MSRVKIVGGGLTGILAAFEAHRLGVRDIQLYERFDQLGGVALPETRLGLEMREGCIYFGPKDDPIRTLLEAYGPTFEDFDNRFGSVSPDGAGGVTYVDDFGGPALPCHGIGLTPPAGPSLADRLNAYPPDLRDGLTRYARWHLGHDLKTVHGDAAIPMAINRVFPRGSNLADLAEIKRHDALADELYAIPRALWGRTANLTASLPKGGFTGLLRRCRLALEAIGVTLHDQTLVSPRQALTEHASGEVLVWAANPTPMFKAAGVATPKLLPKSFSTHVFAAAWTGARPFYVQNFTAEGACFRIYIYESAGQTLLTAECVRESPLTELRQEIHHLLRGFEGELVLGDVLSTSIKPRWVYHSLEALQGLAQLRLALADRMGDAFVAGAWEPYAKGQKFAEVNAGLARALGVEAQAAAA
jgi:hypothetical protein